MLNASASASSSNARNRLPCLCLGFADWLLRGAGVFDAAPPPLPERRSLEKYCWVDESAAGLIWLVEEACEALEDETGSLLGMVGGFDMFLGTDGQRRRQEGGAAGGGEGSKQRWSLCRAWASVGIDRWRCVCCSDRQDPVGSLVCEGERVVEDSDGGDDTRGVRHGFSRPTKLSNDNLH